MQLLIQLDVDDLARGIGFYRRGLGLSLARTLSGGAVAEMLGGGAPIYLRASRAAMPGMRRPLRAPARLDFVVADLEAAIERALAAGAELEDWPQDLPEGRCAMLCDPFGHGLCFVEWHGHEHARRHAPAAAAGRPPRRAAARGGALPG